MIRIGEEKGSFIAKRNNLLLQVNGNGKTGRCLKECDIIDVTNKKDDGLPRSTEILEYSFINVLPFSTSYLSLLQEKADRDDLEAYSWFSNEPD